VAMVSHSMRLLLIGAVALAGVFIFSPSDKPELAALDEAVLKKQWNSVVGSNYSPQEWLLIKQDAKDRQILQLQAISIGLHETDPVVLRRLKQLAGYLNAGYVEGLEYSDEIIRRRLVQLMEERLVSQANIAISDADIVSYYALNAGQYFSEPRVSFKHIFLVNSDTSQDILLRLNKGSDIKGDTFLAGHDFVKVAQSRVIKSFGIRFFTDLELGEINRWQGPIDSSFGYHWVRLSEYSPPHLLSLESQQDKIRVVLYEQRRKEVLAAQLINLRDNYKNGRVIIPRPPASSP
jgi:parvulin-like peptidyl-prolyl isomerase